MTKIYRKKYSGQKRGFLFVIFILAIGLIVAFNVADVISSMIIGKGSIFYNGIMYISSKTFYAISCDNFAKKDDAITLAGTVASKGGAGFVYQSGDYYVLLSMYSSQVDAQSVKEKLKEDKINAKIININIPKLEIKFSESDKNISKLAKEFLDCFEYLYDIAVKYDAGSLTYEQCRVYFTTKIAELEYVKGLDPTTKEGLEIKNKALKMIEMIKNLTLVSKEGYLLNSAIKYAYFEIVFDYIVLCKSIS